MKRRILCVFLVLVIAASAPQSVRASEMGDMEAYCRKLIQYYLHHQERAEDVIWDQLQQMKALDPAQSATWEKIMADWAWVNGDMPVYQDGLPDGLPEDDSLCIVVMGYGLNPDGTMREELVDRLVVALLSALQYPNAYVLLTGGQTGEVDGVTEAGQMAAWLQNKGIEKSRLIQEKQSLSTVANAVNTYKLLRGSYPQVDSIAVITSDYHIRQSCAYFTAVSNYNFGYKGGKPLELVGNAVCHTGKNADTLATQAWGISLILGIPFDENAKAPALYAVDRPAEPLPQPTEEEKAGEKQPWFAIPKTKEEKAPDTQEQEQKERSIILPVLTVTALVAVLYLLTPKRPKKKNKRQRPKMNWDSDKE